MWGKETFLHIMWWGRTKRAGTATMDELEVITSTISCHALDGINTPQTLNIEWYIKTKKVTNFIDSGSTHNIIDCKVSKDLNWFVYPTPEFQVMIADGGTINFSRKFYNINLTLGNMYWIVP